MTKFKLVKNESEKAEQHGEAGSRVSSCPSCEGHLYEQVYTDSIREKTKSCDHAHDFPATYDACVEHHLFKPCSDESLSRSFSECEIGQLMRAFAAARPEDKPILHRAIWALMRDAKSDEVGREIMAKLKGKIPEDGKLIGMIGIGPSDDEDEDEILSKPVGKKETFH